MYKNETRMYISKNMLDISLFSMYNEEKMKQENKICINLHFPTSE